MCIRDRLEAALRGEVSQELISENLRYYDNYISQETSGGRSEAEVIEEIGSPVSYTHLTGDAACQSWR